MSFIIGHRGRARVPHLLATLSTIAAQVDVAIECIVVEQSMQRELDGLLPSWVRYVHTPTTNAAMPYCRSWTLNVGARVARGELLVLHDNDMLVPRRYAAEACARWTAGYEVINLKRFIFYLSEKESVRVLESMVVREGRECEAIVQNLEAGGSIVISRHAYLEIGGFDESFLGWGGEDNEFWERAQTLKVWPFAYMPLVHLWHEPQREKLDPLRPSATFFRDRSLIPATDRIAELRARDFGNTHHPDAGAMRASQRWSDRQGSLFGNGLRKQASNGVAPK